MLVSSLASADFQGRVVGICDGDTISVLREGKAVKVRLQGVDCPENGQPFGRRAKQAASELVFNQMVTVREFGQDRYGRIIADIVLPDGRLLNNELVRSGLAWWYQKYATDNKVLADLQAEAKQSQKGLWSDPRPVPPWQWRQGERASISKKTEIATEIIYHGNVNSRIFHRPGCGSYNCKNCTAVFKSREEAIKAGYRPCKICDP